MITYTIKVKNSAGDFIGEFEKFKNLQIGKRLNNYGICKFNVPVSSDKASSLIALRQYSVWVYRNGVLEWSGEQVIREGNLDNKGDNWCTITCFDWLEQFNTRFTADEVIYTATDAGDIAWDLIDVTQTDDDLGITLGTIEATMNRDRTYNNQNIMDALINLTNVINGFDFEITNLKIFNVYGTKGVDRSNDIVLEYGVNLTGAKIIEDFSKPVTRAIVIGDSGVPSDPLRTVRDDLSLQALYKVREGLINEMTVSEIASLEEKGDALINLYGNALLKLSIDLTRITTIDIDDFSLGDVIRVKIKSGVYDLDSNYRIFEWSVNYQDDNTEKLDLVLGNFNISEVS